MTCDDDIVLALYSDCAWHQLMREHASRSSDAPNTVQKQPKHNQNIIQLNTVQTQPEHNPSINPNTTQTLSKFQRPLTPHPNSEPHL